MTTWVAGDVITSAWLNTVEPVLAMGTYAAVADPRLTMAPNDNFDIGSDGEACNLRLNGSITVDDVQTYAFIDANALTTTFTNANGISAFSSALNITHAIVNGLSGAFAYGVNSSLTCTAGSHAMVGLKSKVNGIDGSFTGIQYAILAELNQGTVDSNSDSTIINARSQNSSATALAYGIRLSTSGTGTITKGFHINTLVDLTGSAYSWKQKAATTALFLSMTTSADVSLFSVAATGNLAFAADGTALTTGQLITGDMSNATQAKRLMFQTATTDGITTLGAIPNGTATSSAISLYDGTDPDNAGRLALSGNASGNTINSTKSGTGTLHSLSLQMSSVTQIKLNTNADLQLGQSGAAAADTTGHMYIQAVAGAVTGVPTTYAGYVPMRYDSTNNFLYIYNGGWKKSTVYA